jgi:DNA-directed RNA polymerase subunit RPC12/RpoP
MCFFIAGVQPKTRMLDNKPQRCPRCGLYQAYTQQVDHYISLFFIPLLRIKQGMPFLYCRRCGQSVEPGSGQEVEAASFDRPSSPECKQCGHRLEGDFKYCPYCGAKTCH